MKVTDLIILASLLGAPACTGGISSVSEYRAESPSTEGEVIGRVAASRSGSWQPVYIGQDFSQAIQYGTELDPGDPNQLLLKNETLDTSTAQWSKETFSFAASFEIRRVSSAKQDRLYVLGIAANGEYIIERWKRNTVKPGNLGGGAGAPGYVMKRTELYRGSTLGVISWIGADPLERYLLLIHGTGSGGATLSQMSLPNGQPAPLWDATQIPNLTHITAGYPQNHQTQGRLWVLSVFGADDPLDPVQQRTILYDTDDNGVLDSYLTMDEPTWEAMGYTQDVWDGDFVLDLGW